jgi:hypothetical protein
VPPLLELESELLELELAPSELELEPSELEVVVVLLVGVVANDGVACPVVGTVNGGAPLASFEPDPLPQAATASAAATAAQDAINPR